MQEEKKAEASFVQIGGPEPVTFKDSRGGT
jgi:hypothetical protein